MKSLKLSVCLFVLAKGAVFLAEAETRIERFHIGGGGGTSSGGALALSGIIGQPAAGSFGGGPFWLVGGFLSMPVAVQVPEAPTLVITAGPPGFGVISWTRAGPGYVLQFRESLSTGVWENVPSGATNPVNVPLSGQGKYYRLIKPQ